MPKTYLVVDSNLLIPQYQDGKPIGINRNAQEGDILTDQDLEFVDVERLLALNSISILTDSEEVKAPAEAKETKKDLIARVISLGGDIQKSVNGKLKDKTVDELKEEIEALVSVATDTPDASTDSDATNDDSDDSDATDSDSTEDDDEIDPDKFTGDTGDNSSTPDVDDENTGE